ncbi:MAG TPA: DUF402 domain-containing protein [Nitrospirota bacterium]|nr:DUF402 domain-containing protein [Nitrospirota bacterium]
MAACVEKKITLSGATHRFSCELLRLDGGFGVLRYVIERPYDVSGTQLFPGDVTYALYWTDRPYTLYVWRFGGSKAAYYFNIADSVSLRPEEFSWRDLAVDVLIDADGNVRVLDENEVPDDTPLPLRSCIEAAKANILAEHERIIREANAILAPFLGGDRR